MNEARSFAFTTYNFFAELNDLHLPESIKITEIEFEPSIAVEIEIFPDEGPFSGAVVHFTLSISEMYPHRPPKARIHEKARKLRFLWQSLFLIKLGFLDFSSKFRFGRARLFEYFTIGLESGFGNHGDFVWIYECFGGTGRGGATKSR